MNEVQVVIIGGGAMGTSLLYHLAKNGWKDIVLVEKNKNIFDDRTCVVLIILSKDGYFHN